MEVVGATASIIAVIQITGTVISICYDYQSSTSHYSKDRLADLASSQSSPTSKTLPSLDSLNEPGGPLEICKIELKELELKLTPPKGRIKQIGRALTWPLKEKDVQKTIDTLARRRGLFQLALEMDQTAMTITIQQATSNIEGTMTLLAERFETVTATQRYQEICRWLAAPDPSSNHNKATKTKQPETGCWLLESPSTRSGRANRHHFFGFMGSPDVHTHSLAYYYFDFNDTRKQTCEGLVRSLVTQLSRQSLESSKKLEALYSQFEKGHEEPNVERLVKLMRRVLEEFEETYLVIDALDECTEIPEVISFLDEMRNWGFQNIHILITSRRERVIEEGLRLLITERVSIQNALVDGDIKLLIHERLRSDRELSRWSETLKAEIEKTLYEGSKGMFRWAVCQIDALLKCIKPSAVRKALASLPKTLDDTYERILCSIDEEHAEDALKVLQWLAFSNEPLKLREVAEATAITLGDMPRFDPEDRLRHPTDILAICSSLIHLSAAEGFRLPSPTPPPFSEEDHTQHLEVRLAHYSVKEYLVSERIKRAKAAFYSICEASANVFLARSCLVYLMYFDKPLSDPVAAYLYEYPLLWYSAREWDIHVARVLNMNHGVHIDSVLRDFFLSENSACINCLLVSKPLLYDPPERQRVGDYTDFGRRICLYYASRLGLLKICKTLLEQGMRAGHRTSDDLLDTVITPSGIAVLNAHEAAVQLLLNHDTDVYQRDRYSLALLQNLETFDPPPS
ncbi:MAG: hypothetical protein ASARMPRED_002451 [Alectoria sarmentosa]|nr:MAG: hypothetical protein ASARMPRED_002451 [Alectoria sarmentosa]